ncbi:energy transducer TonB [Flavobacterium gawalongense]|uniref:Energy transducer TonB n=1 Tax=Flavobacterium gawalongense TaxID=2594432 RepID=A0A553BYI3_9FLAO|nr:energy transducer TonB [Flavobacterium gawalongense]TRX01135.1 energy transducer TonB [Flavobacterium gawalongense]TRX05628.1 energy transducer TonB [Flavobacterium gawalongense]TRX13289.1 energy transducer TonB [Flavobacterium gawalongense]TRX15779.1 energy transducer TonB [Flavobacterium gawalongense]TRX31617.1 energy transducer TonB [Flavobacterium gawalongense]
MSSTISSDQKKSLAISILLYATMLLILFFIRFWPPSNMAELAGGGGGGGVTVNFGDSDLGSGANYKSEVLEVKNQTKQTPTKTTPDEAILSQENSNEESVVIPQKEKTKKPITVVKEEPKPVVVKPKVSNNTNDALSSILKGSNKGGDGDDKATGNKGKSNGSLSSNGYYGTGGSGGGTGGGNGTGTGIGTGSGYGSGSGGGTGSGSGGGVGYSLGNRKAISKPAPKYTCNEQGKVVVEVSVDRNGRTINAVAGIKGTTNTAKCLLDQARIAAMNTKWDASGDAPEKQVGKIVYNFNLN